MNQTPSNPSEIAEAEKREIRRAVAIVAAMEEAGRAKKKKSIHEIILSFLSNGFVLLIVGSIITAIFVPWFENEIEIRDRRLALMRNCHQTFHQYETSIWKEYYSLFPVLHEQEINKDTYIAYTKILTDIKLERYRSYSTLKSLAVAFRPREKDPSNETKSGDFRSEVEKKIESYAIKVNSISGDMSAFLGSLYCKDAKCWSSFYSEPIPPKPLELFNEITREMQGLVSYGEQVAESMVKEIQRE